jgi:predicted cobalt transporter CbtA
MVGALLLRGMLAGLIAGILCFGFLKFAGEPSVDRAIAVEDQLEKSKAASEPAEEMPEIFSRQTQAGIGLLTGVVVYSAAFGGLFALVFAFAYGRVGPLDARATAAMLAIAGLIAVYLVPNLKYPANPPAVGRPETIGERTALYFTIMVVSIAAMAGVIVLFHRTLGRLGGWNAALLSAALYFIIVVAAGWLLPAINEVPDQFPAVVLWQFRIASIGSQCLMWATIGLLFGYLAEREAGVRRTRWLNQAIT